MNTLRTPWITQIMVHITMLGDALMITLISIVTVAWLLSRKNIPAALHLGAAIIFGSILIRVLKVTLQVPRPDTSLFTDMHTFSFPSGHVTMSVMLYGFLAIIICRELRPDKRIHVYLGFGTLIGLISLSRLYLGVHWLSDILGGLALGLSWITLLGIAYRRHASAPLAAGSMLAVSLGSILIIGILYWQFNFDREWKRYTAYNIQVVTLKDWRHQGWQQLPAYRRDLAGSSSYPFNIQWADTPAQISQTLAGLGWQPAKRINGKNLLQWMSKDTGLADRPVLPQVHQGRHDQLAMIYQDGDATWIIRFWHSGYRWQGQDIWVGQAARMDSQSFLKLFYYPVTGHEFNQPTERLQQQLPAGHVIPVTRQPADNTGKQDWDGKTLLIDIY
jgi:undecaprenyl-diphosphatase